MRAAQNVKEISQLHRTHSTAAHQCYSRYFTNLDYSRGLSSHLIFFGVTFIIYIHFALNIKHNVESDKWTTLK